MRIIKKFIRRFRKKGGLPATIIPRSEHSISRKNISHSAIKVLYRLKNSGFDAFLVGGGVRDLLLGHTPKDFDIATNATPEQVRQLFRNSILIGRRFKLVHVRFGPEIIEVATFRAAAKRFSKKNKRSESGMILRDNIYGKIEDDVIRRDFTINALYYNIADFSLVDYTAGAEDLKSKTLRIIGDPVERYKEDPVRMLRAIRFAAKLGFEIHPETAQPIREYHEHLRQVPPSRLFEEVLKLLLSGRSAATYELLVQYQLFDPLFPDLNACINDPHNQFAEKLLQEILKSTDSRIAEDKIVSPAFLFAALLWCPLQRAIVNLQNQGLNTLLASQKAINQVINHQTHLIAIPRRLIENIRAIWNLQYRLAHRSQRTVQRVLHHTRFRAGYDFLLMRAAAGEDIQPLADWWTECLNADEEQREKMLLALSHPGRSKRKK